MKRICFFIVSLLIFASTSTFVCFATDSIDLVETHTSNVAQYGTASSDSEYKYVNFTYSAFRAFNDNTSLDSDNYYGWASANVTRNHWLSYEFTQEQVVNGYSLATADGAIGDITVTNMPKSWTIQGYDSSSNSWVDLDIKTNQPNWTLKEKRNYTFSNQNAYRRYRILVAEIENTTTVYKDITCIGEMELFNVNPSVASTLELDKHNVDIVQGAQLKLIASIVPENPIKKTIKWTSSDTTIADVDQTGNVTTFKSGSITITATCVEDESLSDQCIIKINPLQISNRAILMVTFTNGQTKEYDFSAAEISSYLAWYENKSNGVGKNTFLIIKSIGKMPYTIRTEYIIFDKISSFEVMEYSE